MSIIAYYIIFSLFINIFISFNKFYDQRYFV